MKRISSTWRGHCSRTFDGVSRSLRVSVRAMHRRQTKRDEHVWRVSREWDGSHTLLPRTVDCDVLLACGEKPINASNQRIPIQRGPNSVWNARETLFHFSFLFKWFSFLDCIKIDVGIARERNTHRRSHKRGYRKSQASERKTERLSARERIRVMKATEYDLFVYVLILHYSAT